MKKQKKTEKKVTFHVQPLADRVLIKEIEVGSGSETKSGIIIPETINDDKGAKKGTVIAVGKGRYDDGKLIPVSVSAGNTVLFQWGDLIKVDGVEYYIVTESNILAIIN